MEPLDAKKQRTNATQRVWTLDKTLCTPHQEYERLTREHDLIALRLCRHGIIRPE